MQNFLEFLYQALEHPYGIAVSTNNPERLRVRLYEARRQAQNPNFEALTFTPSRSNPAGELWIIRKDQVNGP